MNDYGLVHREPAPERYGLLRVESADLSPAHWVTRRAPGHGDFGTVAGVAAPGYAAYARILHPAELDERPVRWSTVASAYGREVAPGTDWHALIGMDRDYHNVSEYGLVRSRAWVPGQPARRPLTEAGDAADPVGGGRGPLLAASWASSHRSGSPPFTRPAKQES